MGSDSMSTRGADRQLQTPNWTAQSLIAWSRATTSTSSASALGDKVADDFSRTRRVEETMQILLEPSFLIGYPTIVFKL